MPAEATTTEPGDAEAAASAERDVASLNDWLLDERLRTSSSAALLQGFAERLMDAGLPLDRVTLHLRELHPQFRGRTLLWCPDQGEVEEVGRAHGIEHDRAYLDSPLAAMDARHSSIRRRLEGAERPHDFPILDELSGRGFTDYCMLRVPASFDRDLGLSLATKRAGGFAAAELEVVRSLLPAFGAVVELSELKRAARLLLDTYVGRQAGERVLKGTIRRGDGEVIHAVVWFCDLHDFTALSQTTPLAEVIALLNDYFDAVAAPVQARGGEVLKFIGDAVLAVFPCDPSVDQTCRAVDEAVDAAESALAALAELNRGRVADGGAALDAGIAVHLGEVMYGNVGASDRLDFTVIGPAVNLVGRLQEVTDGLDSRIVVSEAVARRTRRRVRALGDYVFKGIAEPQRAFAVDAPKP